MNPSRSSIGLYLPTSKFFPKFYLSPTEYVCVKRKLVLFAVHIIVFKDALFICWSRFCLSTPQYLAIDRCLLTIFVMGWGDTFNLETITLNHNCSKQTTRSSRDVCFWVVWVNNAIMAKIMQFYFSLPNFPTKA